MRQKWPWFYTAYDMPELSLCCQMACKIGDVATQSSMH
jgi:hypothetical protein